MSKVYELIGRAVVGFVRGGVVVGFVRYRYGQQLRAAAAVGIAAAVVGAIGVYAATREDDEV